MVVVVVVEEISAKSSFSSSGILKVTTSETRRYLSKYLGEKRRHKHTPWHYRAQHEEAPKYINAHTHTRVLLK